MITEVYIDGFRMFKDFKIQFTKLVSLISGLNGTGKSSIIEVVDRLKHFIGNGLTVKKLCPLSDIPVWENREYGRYSTQLGLKLCLNNDTFEYKVKILHNLRDKLSRVDEEYLLVNNNIVFKSLNGRVTVFSSSNKQDSFPIGWDVSGLNLLSSSNEKVALFLDSIQEKIICISLNPYKIQSFNHGNEKNLCFNGENFSAWYAWIKSNCLREAVLAMDDIGQSFPNFNQFDFINHGTAQELISLMTTNSNNTYKISFDQFSHGQKVIAVLYMLIRTCKNDSSILIDEMENFISQVELQPLYDAANQVTEDKQIQFVFISHNEKTLNWYQSDIIFLSLTEDFPPLITIEDYSSESDLSLEDRMWIERNK